MTQNNHHHNEKSEKKISRRGFLKCTGTVLFVAGSGLYVNTAFGLANANAQGINFPASEGYLLVDIEKCQGCLSCMLACSLVHEGVESLSMARIQVNQNSFKAFPGDLTISQCRQCVDPACVKACPEEALTINAEFGNVRMVDLDKCIGCEECTYACPFTPSRSMVAENAAYGGEDKAHKCDLCANTPYHWIDSGGGPKGKQACVEVCPMGAIKFTTRIPEQVGDAGYKINLKDETWKKLGFHAL